MGEKIAYYLFVLPLSHLPMWVLYRFSDLFYILLITIIPYRNKVITKNIENSFPKLNLKERNRIKRRFYRHFSDLIVEGVKNLSITEEGLKKRVVVENPELMQELFELEKNVLLISGHYGNWEWLIKIQDKLFAHKAYGLGMPMTSKFWDKKVNSKRERLGMHVVHAKNYKEELKRDNSTPLALLLLSDQSPGDSLKSYWMDFLSQKTAVLFGVELMTYELGYTPVFFVMNKIKRGYYEMELISFPGDVNVKQYGMITEWHTRELEKAILKRPEFWLWSHKRWKREIPKDLEALKKEQHEKFDIRFKS